MIRVPDLTRMVKSGQAELQRHAGSRPVPQEDRITPWGQVFAPIWTGWSPQGVSYRPPHGQVVLARLAENRGFPLPESESLNPESLPLLTQRRFRRMYLGSGAAARAAPRR